MKKKTIVAFTLVLAVTTMCIFALLPAKANPMNFPGISDGRFTTGSYVGDDTQVPNNQSRVIHHGLGTKPDFIVIFNRNTNGYSRPWAMLEPYYVNQDGVLVCTGYKISYTGKSHSTWHNISQERMDDYAFMLPPDSHFSDNSKQFDRNTSEYRWVAVKGGFIRPAPVQ